ncbi:sal-like protein 1 [Hippocampus zosterae]|uniref:sal-like protein 1 n=1 Tax=Hippocampus zosterae TaxID=109293 RepID=UPI00223CA191|nr:sal-like protein 1 [Hippocampus zosterae]
MCTRTSEYEDERCGEKEDHKGQRQLLDAIGRMQPRVLHRLDTSKDVCPERLDAESSHMNEKEEKKEISHLKEEVEQQGQYIKEQELQYRCTKVEVDDPPDIKEEDDEEVICKVPFTGVLQKSINEADREAPSTSSCQHMTTKGVGNHQEESKVNGILAPRSESDNMSLNADEDEEDEDDSEGDLTCNADNKPCKCSHCGKMCACKSALEFQIRTHTGAKPFTCSNCVQKFSYKTSLKSHKRTHTVCGQRFSWKHQIKNHKCDDETSSHH